MKSILLLFAAIFLGRATGTSFHGIPHQNNSRYRLANSVIPTAYKLSIDLTDDVFATQYFDAYVMIDIEVTEPTKHIVLHSSKHIHIRKIFVTTRDENEYPVKSFSYNSETQLYNITMKHTLDVREYNLFLEYNGTLLDHIDHGFYKSYYHKDGMTKYLAATQFQPTHARRAFPCFDEPKFKATFKLTITYPKNYTALFNTKLAARKEFNDSNLATSEFIDTPPMSTYLVAFVVADFDSTTSDQKIDGSFNHSVWSRKGSAPGRELAVELGPRIFTALERFTGVTLNDMNLEKIDQIAIPDFGTFGMENWGLTAYRENQLLSDAQSNTHVNESIARLIAHELCHFWFGNYVTLNWWSEIWLNEGFPSYFEYHGPMETVLLDAQLSRQFVVDVVQSVMLQDSGAYLHAMSDYEQDINTPIEIAEKFNSVAYYKSAAVIHMFRHILGDELFQTVLRTYLQKFKFSNVESINFFETAEEVIPTDFSLPFKITDFMEIWIWEAGFPILQVAVSGRNITFRQEKCMIVHDAGDNSTWYIPISFTTSVEKNFTDTRPRLWLQHDIDHLTYRMKSSADWVIVNIQESGYYRVNYDDVSWSNIATVLKNNHTVIHVMNRAQIVDDVLNLARIGKINYKTVFEVIDYLKNETEYFPWRSALRAYEYLLGRTERTKLEDALKIHLRNLMEKVFNSLSSPDARLDHIGSKLQDIIWYAACKLDNENCTRQAEQLFNEQMKNPSSSVPVDLRRAVYCSAVRTSKDKGAWEYLWNRYMTTGSSSEKATILEALGCSKDSAILNDYLNKAITRNSGIRMQDTVNVFEYVVKGNPESVMKTFDFIVKEWSRIIDHYAEFHPLAVFLSGVGDYLTTEEEVQKLEEFVKNTFIGEWRHDAHIMIDHARSNLKWSQQHSKELYSIFHIPDSAGTTTASVILLLVSFFVLIL